jgi:hypothetical protein
MNKRIQQLAEQCTDQYRDGRGGYIDHVDIEKFAELIVEECIGIVENLSPGYADYRNQIEDTFRRDCVEKIKEHFGVKE